MMSGYRRGRPRAFRMRRALPILLFASLSAASLPVAPAAIPGDFCVEPPGVRVLGTATQVSVYLDHFIEQYEIICPPAQGIVSYDPGGEAAAVEGAISHDYGNPLEPTVMYATDLALSASEYNQAFMDARHIFNPALLSFLNHFPTHVYGVAAGYNLGSCAVSQPVRFTPRTLSLIYSGMISRWNDQLLVIGDPADLNDNNPELASCNLSMKVSIRHDWAASTAVLKDYLSQENDLFTALKLKEINTSWPSTLTPNCSGTGEVGMATCLNVAGRIGYIDYREASFHTTFSFARLRNRGGQFLAPATNVTPTASRVKWPNNCPAAAETVTAATTRQDWSQVTLTRTPSGYPMCNFGYALMFWRPTEASHNGVAQGAARTGADLLEVIYMDSVQNNLPLFRVAWLPLNIRELGRTGVQNNLSG